MDPTANLAEQLALAETLLEESIGDDADRLAELVLALHEWIVKGGFFPDQWRRND
jgi:hypothetical protein